MFNSALDEVPAPPPLETCVFDLTKLTKAQRTFFYVRMNEDGEEFGERFACNEQEADLIRRNIHKGFYRLLGASDGTTFARFIRECGVKHGESISIERAQQILKDAFEAEFEVAKGKKMRPQGQHVHLDSSILMHRNGKEIASSLQLPE